jgi:hypothetical protein
MTEKHYYLLNNTPGTLVSEMELCEEAYEPRKEEILYRGSKTHRQAMKALISHERLTMFINEEGAQCSNRQGARGKRTEKEQKERKERKERSEAEPTARPMLSHGPPTP